MYKGLKIALGMAAFFASCKEWNDASKTPRDTYLTFFDYSRNFAPVAVSEAGDGFVMAAVYSHNSANSNTLPTATRFIKMDARGNRIWVRDFPKTHIKTVLTLADGFILVGDSAHAHTEGDDSKIKIIKTNSEGIVQNEKTFSIRTSSAFRGDVEVDAAVFNEASTDSLVAIGRMIRNDADSIFIAKFKTSTLELLWKRREAPLGEGRNLDYKNGKSLLRLPNNHVIWVSSGQTSTGIIKNLFGVAPVYSPYLPNATFVNSAKIGNSATDDAVEEYQLKDIAASDSGFGLLGTYTSGKEEKSTAMLFARLQENGNLNQESQLFIDYDPADKALKTYTLADRNKAIGTLQGETLAASQGGYVLAGTFYNTAPSRGAENDTDMIIIKLDAVGAILWFRTFGGKGKEIPARIRTDAHGRITVVGEQTYKGLTVGFMLQVNANGDF